MTKEEIAVLGHAFFDGKVLQLCRSNTSDWTDWIERYCPDFQIPGKVWRIKPEPKVVKYICVQCPDSSLEWYEHESRIPTSWKRIPALDKEVTVEE